MNGTIRSPAIKAPLTAPQNPPIAMPVVSLSFVVMAQMARMSRAALIGTLDSSYVEMAVLKGARPARIVLRHALPNALGPIVNAVALSLSFLLGGVIIIETIFNYPGLAKLMVDAVSTRCGPENRLNVWPGLPAALRRRGRWLSGARFRDPLLTHRIREVRNSECPDVSCSPI